MCTALCTSAIVHCIVQELPISQGTTRQLSRSVCLSAMQLSVQWVQPRWCPGRWWRHHIPRQRRSPPLPTSPSPLSPAMPLTACHVHLFYATSSIPTFVFQPLLLLYLPYSSYLHSAAARKSATKTENESWQIQAHLSRGKGQLDNIARSVFSAANTRPLPTAPTNCSMRVALTVENTGL